jgi:hypothetical protein
MGGTYTRGLLQNRLVFVRTLPKQESLLLSERYSTVKLLITHYH